MKRYALLATLVAAALLGACAKESKLPQATGQGTIRALNAIATSPRFSLLIEERRIGEVQYKTVSSPAQYDDLDYVFNVEVLLAGDTAQTRVASQPLNVAADKDYTFVISGAIAAPDLTIWEGDVREWGETDTTFEVTFGHTATTLVDSVDVYFTDITTPPVNGLQMATLTYGEIGAPADFTEGSYILTVTPAGDDTTILLQSDPIRLEARTQILISLFDGDANDLAPLVAYGYNKAAGGTFAFRDVRFPRTAKFYHASKSLGSMEIYVDDPLTVPLISGHAFRDVTAPQFLPEGIVPITYLDSATMGVMPIDVEGAVAASVNTNFYAIETTGGEYVLVDHVPDLRPIETRARVSFMNTVTGHPSVDLYLVPPGEAIDELSPAVPGLSLGFTPLQLPVAPKSYDIYVTLPGEKTTLTGPIAFDPAFGDVINFVIYENDDPGVVDLVSIPLL
jgi:hypothetical protein